MHRRIRIAAAALALAVSFGPGLAACSSSSTTPTTGGVTVKGIEHLGVDDFAALASTRGTVLVDVRTPGEFAGGHLLGARDLDLQAADFDAQLASLDHSVTYAVYCHSGNRSGQALQRMHAAGFTHAADLSGGITAWTAAGKPTTTS